MLDHSCQVQRHPLAERGTTSTRRLRSPCMPCCASRIFRIGYGSRRRARRIVNVLRAPVTRWLPAISSTTAIPAHYYRVDFLMERKRPDGCEAIVTNPPFKLAEEFWRTR